MRNSISWSKKLLILFVTSACATSAMQSASATNCNEIKQSQKKFAQLGQKELKQATDSWKIRKNSFTPSPEYFQLQKEKQNCNQNPEKYARKMGDPKYAETRLNSDGSVMRGVDGKPIKCWPLIARALTTPGNFQEPQPQLDYQDSYQISQVIIHNNPQCFDAGLVVQVQRWVKRHPSALN